MPSFPEKRASKRHIARAIGVYWRSIITLRFSQEEVLNMSYASRGTSRARVTDVALYVTRRKATARVRLRRVVWTARQNPFASSRRRCVRRTPTFSRDIPVSRAVRTARVFSVLAESSRTRRQYGVVRSSVYYVCANRAADICRHADLRGRQYEYENAPSSPFLRLSLYLLLFFFLICLISLVEFCFISLARYRLVLSYPDPRQGCE